MSGAVADNPPVLSLRFWTLANVFTFARFAFAPICAWLFLTDTYWGVWVGGWIRRAGLDPLYRAFRGLERLSESNSGNDQRFRRWALDVARDYRADIVVTGHTHRAQCHEEGPRVFLNSGSCQEGRFSFSALDTARGTFGVHGFEP